MDRKHTHRVLAARKGTGFEEIPVEIYRLRVVVAWGMPAEKVEALARRKGIQLGKDFRKQLQEHLEDDVLGLCMKFKNANADLLVWLGEPSKLTLAHELYHAVDSITEDRNLAEELEARAYLFEYLLKRALEVFRKAGVTLK